MSQETKVLFSKTPVTLRVVTSILVALTLAIFMSCGGGGGGSSSTPPTLNPVPSVTGLSPSSAMAGAATQTLTVNGTNFVSTSTVAYNGAAHTATFVSSTQLTISLSASDQASAGTYPVAVTNPSPGGGTSNAVDFVVNNPAPTISAISPDVIAAGATDTTVTVSGTNFLPTSTASLNGVLLATSFISSTELNAIVPASSLAQPATTHLTVTNPLPGGGTSSAQPLTVTAIGSLVIMATPANGGQGNGPWQVSIAAVDSQGTAVPGLAVSLNTSAGVVSQAQGITDSSGTFKASVSPPASYSGEAVAVSATAGSQTAAINIAFVPSTFNPSDSSTGRNLRKEKDSSNTTTTLNSPFLFGISGPPGSDNPFLTNPDLCYSNADLGTTVPANCQFIYTGKGIVQGVLDVANTICTAGTTLVGGTACVGLAVTGASCLSGIGAAICVGGITYSGVLSDLCLGFLSNVLAEYLLKNPTDKAAVDAIGVQPGPPNTSGAIGLICDAVSVASIGSGTGSSGTAVGVSPPKATVLLGSTVGFTPSVAGTTNTTVTWSVNGVPGGSGLFGTVDSNGVYTAPSALPSFPWVTVRATSVSDATASAPAVVHVVTNLPGTMTTVAGNGMGGYSGDDGPATNAELSTPTGVAFDGGRNMFIADSKNNVIRRVDASTGVITTIAGNGIAGYSGDGGPATSAQLNGPTHAVFDRTVNLYITDANNNRIRKVDSSTGLITTVAGNGISGFSGDGGPATSAELNFPDGVGLDSEGNLYIGDAANNRIRKINVTTGVITTVAGNGFAGYAGGGGLATNAELNFPSRPAIDNFGNIYIADYSNNRVRKVDASTNIITTVAGDGTAGYSGDGGSAAYAQLNGPLSVTVDAAGNLYIGDLNNERIRVVNTTTNQATLLGVTIQPGEIETVAGNGITGYAGDGGSALNAYLNFPTGLLIDPQGNLYFADANNNAVRLVTGQLE